MSKITSNYVDDDASSFFSSSKPNSLISKKKRRKKNCHELTIFHIKSKQISFYIRNVLVHLLNSLPLQISKSSIGPKSNCALEKRQRHPIYLIQIEQNQYISTGVREFRFTKSKEKPYHSEIVIHNWIPLDFGIIIIGHLLLNFNSSKRKEQFFFLSFKFSTFDILLAFIKLNYN